MGILEILAGIKDPAVIAACALLVSETRGLKIAMTELRALISSLETFRLNASTRDAKTDVEIRELKRRVAALESRKTE